MEIINNKNYVKSNNKDEVFNKMVEIINGDRKEYNYSLDNIKAYAISIQPHFIVWLNSLTILEIGGEIIKENAKEEMFGMGTEGNHAILCIDYFAQLGGFEKYHYEKGYNVAKLVYKYLNRPIVILSYLVATELAIGFIQDLDDVISKIGLKDNTYSDIHMEADSVTSEEGHGIKLLKILESENVNIDDINQGIQLYRDFYFELFKNE